MDNEAIRPWRSAYQTRMARNGASDGTECCVCGKKTKQTLSVVCSPENGDFCRIGDTPEASGYYIGPDCAKRVRANRQDVVIVKL